MNPQRKLKLFPGDRYILCRFDLRYGCMVEESNNRLETLLEMIPQYLHEGDDTTLSICQVDAWIGEEMGDLDPYEPRTLYEIHHYDDPEEFEEELID